MREPNGSGRQSSFEAWYDTASPAASAPRERSSAEKAADAEAIAQNLANQDQVVSNHVAAMESAVTAGDLASWTTAKHAAEAAVTQLGRMVDVAFEAMANATAPEVRKRLAGVDELFTGAATRVREAPAAPAPRVPVLSCADELLAVLMPAQAAGESKAVFDASDQAVRKIFRTQMSYSDIRAFKAILSEHKDHEIARRFGRFGGARQQALLNIFAEPAVRARAVRIENGTEKNQKHRRDVSGTTHPAAPKENPASVESATAQPAPAPVAPAPVAPAPVAPAPVAPAEAKTAEPKTAASPPRKVPFLQLTDISARPAAQRQANGGTAAGGDPASTMAPPAAELDTDALALQAKKRGGTTSTTIAGTSDASKHDRDHGPQSAAVYFADNQNRFFEAIRTRLAGVKLAPPHERLVWVGDSGALSKAFEYAMLAVAGTDMDLALALPQLLYPVDPWQLIDLRRDLTSGRPGELVDREPALGTIDWNPIIGQALALEIEGSLRQSLPRMGLRYVAQADDYAGQLGPDMLVASHPFDRVVARLLCDHLVVRFVPDGRRGTAGKRADTDAPAAFKNGIRMVTFEWQGAQDPKLWNWVRVTEPADARAEEVAAMLYDRLDDKSHTEYAYGLTMAPPYVRVPPAWARRFPAAEQHAPKATAREGEGAEASSALDLADSLFGDEAATAQAGKPAAKLDIPRLQHTLDQSEAQLRLASDRLADWNLGYLVGPAMRWILRHKDAVLATPTETLRVWASIAGAQAATLAEAIGDLIEVVDIAKSAHVVPGTPEAKPFRDVIEALAIAMGESQLGRTAATQLTVAKQRKAHLPFTLLDRSLRESHDAAQELTTAGHVPDSESHPTDHVALAHNTNRTLEAGALAIREKAVAGGAIDADELDALTVAASEETLRVRILTLYGKLDQLDGAAEQATEGATGQLGNLFNDDVRNLHRELVAIKPLAWAVLDTMRKDVVPKPPIPSDPALARHAFAQARKLAVATAQAAFAQLTEDTKLNTLFQRALDSISSAQRNTAYFTLAVEIAALIGVSVVGGVAGSLVSGVVRGAFLADAAADTAAFARMATAARVIGGAANVASDAAVQAAGQTAIFGGNTKVTFIENVMMNVMTLGALRPFHGLGDEIGKLDKSAAGLWKVASGGKVVLVAAGTLTIETLVGAGASYVAARLVEGAPPPSEQTAVSWAMQGAAMAVGKFINGKMQDVTARWSKLGEKGVHLLKRAHAQHERAKLLEHSGSTEAALQLLEEHKRLLEDEHALLHDPGAVARLGLDASQLGALRAGNDSALRDSRSQAFDVMSMRFHGLEPVAANGLVWSGTREQIELLLQQSGAAAKNVQQDGAGRWTAKLGGREVTFVEVAAVHKPATTSGHPFGDRVKAIGDDGYATNPARLTALHKEWQAKQPAIASKIHYDAEKNTSYFEVEIHAKRVRIEARLAPKINSFAQLDAGKNRIIGKPIAAADGPAILRALVNNDASALKAVGISGVARMPLDAAVEFGLGEISDGRVVVIRGEKEAVDWSTLPGIEIVGHTHPSVRSNDLPPSGDVHSGREISLDELVRPTKEPLVARELVFPSVPDFLVMEHLGVDGHRVYTPFVVRDGMVLKPSPGETGPRLEFTIGLPHEVGKLPDGGQVYRSRVKGTVGGQSGPPPIDVDVWIVHDEGGGHLYMAEPAGLIPTARSAAKPAPSTRTPAPAPSLEHI
jgi:hypothetical protein